jgi:hypothetical protein
VSDNSTVEHRLEITAFDGMAAQNVLQEFSPELGQFLKKNTSAPYSDAAGLVVRRQIATRGGYFLQEM